MENKEAIREYFESVIKGISNDNAKSPVSKLHFTVDDIGGQLFAPAYFRYTIFGRGPGKFPPPDNILEWVKKNPDVLARARQSYL